MPFLYIVRCRFTRPDLEASWNDWYSGEKTAQLLAKPMFRAVQRFRRSAGAGRDYLALWQVASPAAFGTPEYKADWGFAQWHPYITDWSRDLFDAADPDERTLAVPLDGALGVIAFDGLADGAAAAARAAFEDTEILWCPCVGLDRHTPAIGLRRFDEAAAAQATLARRAAAGVQAGVYRPLGAFARAQPAA
jgi:hypothetical protein